MPSVKSGTVGHRALRPAIHLDCSHHSRTQPISPVCATAASVDKGRAQVLLPRGEAEAVFECGMWTDWWPRRILASMSDLLDLARERMEAFNRRRWRCAQAACPPGPRSIRLAELRRRRWDSRYGGGVVHWMTVGPVAKAGRSTAVTRVSRGRPPGSATVRPWRAPTWTWFVRR
jgi:hypothetical protein